MRTSRWHRKFASAGFTLIELIVVLALLGLASGVAVVSLRRDPPDGDVFRSVRLAQHQAVEHGVTVRIRSWNSGDSTWCIRAFLPDGRVVGCREERLAPLR